jgi:hypothetical protein
MAFVQNMSLGTFEKTRDIRSGRKAWKIFEFWKIDLVLVTAYSFMIWVSIRQWAPPLLDVEMGVGIKNASFRGKRR